MRKFTFIVVLGCDQGESDLSQFSTVSLFFLVKTCLIFPTKDAKYMKIQCMLSAPGFYQEHLVSSKRTYPNPGDYAIHVCKPKKKSITMSGHTEQKI